MKRTILLLCLVLCGIYVVSAQENNGVNVYGVGFYNLENLFDTQKDPRIFDDDFTPEGSYAWTQKKYSQKLNKLADVIARLGTDHCKDGLAVLGVSEIENRRVLEDLVQMPQLAARRYAIVHYDSPDRRGVDVGLIYNRNLFRVLDSRVYPLRLAEDTTFRTRDQLLVKGILDGDTLHVIVNHWPSRRGGKLSNLRERAAAVTRHIADSLYAADVHTKVVILGDFNDNPDDKSCRVVLRARKTQKELKGDDLFNVTWKLWTKGIGSLCYQNQWNLFDQVIVSRGLLGTDCSTLKLWKMEIYNRDFLIQREGRYKGYPMRTFSGTTFQNGYSDHFPVYLYLVKNR